MKQEVKRQPKKWFYVFLIILGITIYCRVNYINSFLELTNYDPLIKKETPTEGQRVVLHVGPHKTGSTSVQTSMIKWTHPSSNMKSNQLICSPNNTHPSRQTIHACGSNSKALLDTWKWPAPKKSGWLENPKSFFHLVQALSNTQSKRPWPLNSQETVALYRTQIFTNWFAGKNLVISAELFDSVTVHQHLIANLLNCMAPAISVQDITVVVVYRAPRIEHLLSLWHMSHGKTFYDYIIQGVRNLSVIDSLGITNEFLAKGFKVDLIDTSGLSSQGYDLSNVLACDILKVQCNLNKTIIGIDDEKLVRENQKSAPENLNVTKEQLGMIDDAIKRFDCIYKGILLHVNVTLHYPDLLLKNNFECSIDISETLPNQVRRQILAQEMQEILIQ